MSVTRLQALKLYKLLLRAPPHVMPTQAGREFMRERVKLLFRQHQKETNVRIVQLYLTHAYQVLQAAAENAERDYVEEPLSEIELKEIAEN
eukprot:TRINITY_DN960_c0_g2_i1.p1 TRINITY_DN960_c0_g2~~TRINITY_DN960_c0_g2_i1.p1  ORF type:complete len:103 (-),score=20.89 TRINITY_DN960_c0_g2_i1:141-413(-)